MRICLIILFLAFVECTYAIGPGPSWQFYRKITLSAATPLANFQVKLTLTAGQYTNMNTSGNDLRFYDANNNVCTYWIEAFNTAGTSTIWVKVPVSGTGSLLMFYGNAAATAVSDGTNTFDFFDDFLGTSLGANWATTGTTNGSIAVSGGVATVTCTGGGTNTSPGMSSQFTPASTSFVLEAKHQETNYNRVRYYAGATSLTMSSTPLGFDYGYFASGGTATSPGVIFYNGFQTPQVTRNTDYLTRWQITNGSTYNWSTINYSSGAAVDSRTGTTATTIRFITIGATEVTNQATKVDWVRVRKANTAFTDPTLTVGNQFGNLSASITAQTNVNCNGQSTGSATVTPAGGATPFTYSWTTTPIQTTQTATGLAAGTYTATVTDNNGLTATATASLTQATTVFASVTSQSNINCFAANDGTITVAATGGTAPYTFSVDNGVNYLPATGTDLRLFTGLLPNTPYRIRVKDNNGCISK